MDDLISRQDAIEYLRNNVAYMQAFGCDRAITLIRELPSAQPETTQRTIKRDGQTHWYECLRCGTAVDLVDKFCRGCGRRFEEEQ